MRIYSVPKELRASGILPEDKRVSFVKKKIENSSEGNRVLTLTIFILYHISYYYLLL